MNLQQELKLPAPFESKKHEALLNILRTAACISKKGDRFFVKFGLTTAQFNLLMVLKYSGEKCLTQVEIANRLLVNRANVTGLIDRMAKGGLLERIEDKKDRRHYLIRLTKKGKRIGDTVDKEYSDEVSRFMNGVSINESKQIIGIMEKLRSERNNS